MGSKKQEPFFKEKIAWTKLQEQIFNIFFYGIITIFFIGIFIFLLGSSTPSDSEIISVVRSEGYANIKLEGYSPFGCGSGDIFIVKFSGTKNGSLVHGVFCQGVLKGATILRFN